MPSRLHAFFLAFVAVLAIMIAPANADDAHDAHDMHSVVAPPTHPTLGSSDPSAEGVSVSTEDLEPRHELGIVRQIAPGEAPEERVVTVEVTTGELAGRAVGVVQRGAGPQGLELEVAPGDKVVLAGLTMDDAAELDWQIVDYQRGGAVYALLGLTAVAMAAVGGLRGLKTLATLAVTLALIGGVLLPLTLRGWPPLPLAVALAAAVALVTTLLTSGAGRKTWAAVAGTTVATAIAALLAAGATSWARLTGMVSEESLAAHTLAGAVIDFQGLLAASMLIGALGVMLDLALSIAAAVDELREANPELDRGLLFRSGWQVGRDLLSTTSNTLLLAYLGGFLPVLLALGAQPPSWTRMPHLEALAGASVTLLVGLMGLVLIVPLTAGAAAALARR